MNNKKLYNIFLLSFAVLILAGCRSGGGGSLGSFSGDAGSSVGGGSLGGGGGGGDLGSVANPEPSTLLLLTSGLIGMAVYAKVRLKSKTKK